MIDVAILLPRCLCSRTTRRRMGSSIRVRNKWMKRAETGNVGDKLGEDAINATQFQRPSTGSEDWEALLGVRTRMQGSDWI